MLRYSLGFICGAYCPYLFADLPSYRLLGIVALAALALLLFRPTRLPGSALVGFLFMCVAADTALDQRLPENAENETIAADVVVIDFPQVRDETVRLLVEPQGSHDLPRRIRLSWHRPTVTPRIGERWQLRVRLRAPRGFSNPGLFDYEAWLLQRGIGATGYVVASSKNRLLSRFHSHPILKLRARLAERVERLLPNDETSAVLLALTVGSRHKLSSDQWEQFASTGTSHLMAISGLHIGLAAGGAFLLVQFLLLPFCTRINLRDWAVIAALLAGLGYAVISGMAVPARRAVTMLALVMLGSLWRRELQLGRVLLMAAVLTCLLDPLAIFSSGYLLSFGAVLALFWTGQQSAAASSLDPGLDERLYRGGRRLLGVQLVLLFGLLPVAAMLFGRVSAIAPLVNMLVLPMFSFLVVPCALLGLLLGGALDVIGDPLLWLAYYAASAALQAVSLAAQVPLAGLKIPALGWELLPICLLPACWVLLPPGWPGRAIAWPAALFLVLYKPAVPEPGCVEVHVLDVGQGSAAVIRSHSATLVYDAGPRFMSGADTGSLVVVPFLESQGIRVIDRMVISHSDLDHAGGSSAVTKRFADTRVVLGEFLEETVGQSGVEDELCIAGQRWNRDGVDFQFLQPGADDRAEGNNASCVLLVETGAYSLLFTGDIERPVELDLFRRGLLKQSTVVMVAHHGSRTSSAAAFVETLSPELAIVSSGFNNRWGFPKPAVVRRWRASGARVLSTADSGAISFAMCSGNGVTNIAQSRLEHRRFWNQKG